MNKIKCILIIAMIAVVAIMAIGVLILKMNQSAPVAVKCPPIAASDSKANECSTSTIISVPASETLEDWKEYINKKLGFSMWIPEKSSDGNKFVGVNIVEDNENNTVYVGASIELSTKDHGWAILVKPVKNDKELEAFIKEKFGSDCTLGKKEYLYGDDNNAVYNVEAIPGEEGMESNCPLNYVYKILYNSGFEKAMAVAIGQECRFSATLDENYGAVCYDELMINSFRFE